MKLGDYVRTEKGIIGKFNIVKTGETIPNWNGGYGYKEIDKEYIDNNVYNRFDDKIIKSNSNIIDLIEVGDYVNGKKVIDKWEEPDWYGYFIKLEGEETVPTIRKIESIVTHEQFSQMEYKVNKND